MHEGPRVYVSERAQRYVPRSVIELGGQDVNGTIRDLFNTDNYRSIDLADGPGVDVVADATTWRTTRRADCVVSTELLEHVQDWPAVIETAFLALKQGGHLVLTCATEPREPHAAEGGTMEDDEYYGNVDPWQMCQVLDKYFSAYDIRVDRSHGDLYVTGRKGGGDL